jgi:hypothetical protein
MIGRWPALDQLAALVVMVGHPRHFEPQAVNIRPYPCPKQLMELRKRSMIDLLKLLDACEDLVPHVQAFEHRLFAESTDVKRLVPDVVDERYSMPASQPPAHQSLRIVLPRQVVEGPVFPASQPPGAQGQPIGLPHAVAVVHGHEGQPGVVQPDGTLEDGTSGGLRTQEPQGEDDQMDIQPDVEVVGCESDAPEVESEDDTENEQDMSIEDV